MKNREGQTPLWIAAFHGHESMVKLLALERNADVNSLSASRESPLLWTSAHGYEDIVQVLLSAGAKIDVPDEQGRTAISMAKRNGHDKIARILESQPRQNEVAQVVQTSCRLQSNPFSVLVFLGVVFTGMILLGRRSRSL
jgi:ankyrin repeat protein